jgi:hypothetical protein
MTSRGALQAEAVEEYFDADGVGEVNEENKRGRFLLPTNYATLLV